jgi:hypothetical protein
MNPGENVVSTTDRLRSDIDRGRTGDKVSASDPAAAPLGTDDEAAGKPPSARAVAQTSRMEVSGAHAQEKRRGGVGSAWILIAFSGVLGAALIGWGAMRMW